MVSAEHMRKTLAERGSQSVPNCNYSLNEVDVPLAIPHGLDLIGRQVDRLYELTNALHQRIEPLLVDSKESESTQPRPSPVCQLHASLLGIEDRLFSINCCLTRLVDRIQI